MPSFSSRRRRKITKKCLFEVPNHNIEKSPASNEEVNVYKKQLLEREEELAELRAERNNTRLLLEHLEFLISQNMPSLQMTAGKQQEQPPASMTSEVEVLRALKFLFDHHKALDEKRSSDGSLSHEQNLAKMSELQEVIDKQLREQSQMEEHLAALSAHMRELEEDLDTARKKLLKSKEVNRKLERDVREAMAQTEDMEKRITTLAKRSLAAQREAAYVHDFNDKPENEIANEDSMHRQARQGEDVKEEHNKPLSDTVDKPVSESDERLQLHLKERMAALEDKVQTLKEQGWDRAQQASVLANMAQAFESDEGVSDGEGDGVTLFSSATQLSPRGQDDAETPTVMLQGQLDAINEEIWLIEEKNTEQPAEETESRVDRGSLSNLRRCKTMSSLSLYPGSSSPSSGRSKPQRRRHSPPQEVDKLGITTGLDRLPGQPREQPQQQQQPGLATQSSKKQKHQVLHQPHISKEVKGPAWTPRQGGIRTRIFTTSATWKAPVNADN
ncbi:liprin-alpha-1-like isoform X2 [Moschus berezovskii]|uniref:liprin-alpha-1-like isoform X2 n=1 Tax=Moschus berezovskii TaxID=68408 RepID=UPI0024452DC9|nr:liprin-alpha-1-like isoform X2 [Moschus berezovskii]